MQSVVTKIKIFTLSIILLILIAPVTESYGAVACPGNLGKNVVNMINGLINVFPVKLGGITVFPGSPDYDDSGATILCVCNMPPPIFIRIGIPLHYWDPGLVMEVVNQPWCSPTLGMSLPVGFAGQSVGGDAIQENNNQPTTYMQTHLINFPLMALVGFFIDTLCLQTTGVDYLYLTEIDPLWQNNQWSVVLNPEALLFGNPIAHLACAVDAAFAVFNKNIDFLFWCAGSNGNVYPLSNGAHLVDRLSSARLLAEKTVYKLHRELLLWQTSGPAMIRGACMPYPFPIWKKNQYNFVALWPVAGGKRHVVGRPVMLWGVGENLPYAGNSFSFQLYRVRDCCVF
jgi:conjugal transfer pilus assembly protein TraU